MFYCARWKLSEASKAKEMEEEAASNNTGKYIDDMSASREAALVQIAIRWSSFSFQIDESTHLRNC